MKDGDEQLLREVSRRNWIILVGFFFVSLFWRSLPVTGGVVGGGLVAIGSYCWLRRSLGQMMAEPTRWSARRFQFHYLIRLAALAVALVFLVAVFKVNPIGLVIGLSVVLVNIAWTTVKRTF